jgi:hypothetical protein
VRWSISGVGVEVGANMVAGEAHGPWSSSCPCNAEGCAPDSYSSAWEEEEGLVFNHCKNDLKRHMRSPVGWRPVIPR